MATQRYALIMAGGRGTRFWPRSRKRNAKQVLRFFGERTLIQQAVDRLAGVIAPENIWILTNDHLREEISKQLPEVPAEQIVAEPSQRNTAPCIALTAQILAGLSPGAVMGVFPADHLIAKEDHFREFVEAAYAAAEKQSVVVLGIQPRWAETGYGYIEFPKDISPGALETRKVSKFREKPDEKTATEFLNAGNFFWNAGMFFWRASEFLSLMREHQPETATLLAGLPPFSSPSFTAKLKEIYPLCENISVDYAVIEKAKDVVGFALDDIGWNDVGSWEAVYELTAKDADGNASTGEVFSEGSHGNYVSAAKPVALVGVEDLVVVDTADALLIVSRSRSQDVSKLVKQLDAQNREELL